MKTVTINDIRGNVLNSVEISDDTPKDQEIKVALEKSVHLRINLQGADLEGNDLAGANLWGADLLEANLREANLRGANLSGADLRKANLKKTFLKGTDLEGANLERAIIKKDILLLKDGYFTVTNIGSEQGTLEVFNTNRGLYFRRWCFFGNEAKFKAEIIDTHRDNRIAKLYLHMIAGAKLRFNS